MSSNKYPYIIFVSLNGRRVKREKFTDYERYMRAYYDYMRRFPESRGYDIEVVQKEIVK